jgi:hypothetical protein
VDVGPVVTLMVAGRPLTFSTRVEGCMPPKVAVPQPGVCPGTKRRPGIGKPTVKKNTATVPKAVAKTTPKARAKGTPKARKLTRASATAMQEQMTADKPWTPEQRDAYTEYTSGQHRPMNATLRGLPGVPAKFLNTYVPDRFPELTQERILHADAGLRPLPHPIKVWRNVSGVESLGIPENKRWELASELRKFVGKRLQERGFMSTSIAQMERYDGNYFGDVTLEIDVPAGVRGAYLRSVAKTPHEEEILLEPGLTMEFYDLDTSGSKPVLRARVVAA